MTEMFSDNISATSILISIAILIKVITLFIKGYLSFKNINLFKSLQEDTEKTVIEIRDRGQCITSDHVSEAYKGTSKR